MSRPGPQEFGAPVALPPSVAAFPVPRPTPDQSGSGETVKMISSAQSEKDQLEELMKRKHISPLAVKKAHTLFGRGPGKSSPKKQSSKSKTSKSKSKSTAKKSTAKKSTAKKKTTSGSKAKKSATKKPAKKSTSKRGKSKKKK